MKIESLLGMNLPKYVIDNLKKNNIVELNPPQEKAISLGVLTGQSLIVSTPTASGKTLIATLAISKLFTDSKGKAIYIVPLKALANEKYNYFKEFFNSQKINVGISTGDFDSKSPQLADKDLIIATVERVDSLLRHNVPWLSQVKLVIADEIHLLNDRSRGPTLEVALTRLKEIIDFQFLGLSATIKNSEELAAWLNCKVINSEYRPVELEEGILYNNEIEFYSTKKDKSEFQRGSNFLKEGCRSQKIIKEFNSGLFDLIKDTLKKDKQALVFVRSRRSGESTAKKSTKISQSFLNKKESEKLMQMSLKAENVLSTPTAQCKNLSYCLKSGVAFHHAGLLNEQKRIIETAFREGLIKIIFATPTLAMGVSLPAYRVIIQDLRRYSNYGLNFIPVLEYKQFAGRAGRPEHHMTGESICIAKDLKMKEEIKKRYIFGDVENIYSKLAVEPILRTHILSLIATHSVSSQAELLDFFSKTFYAYQYRNLSKIETHLENIINNLTEYGFIKQGKELEADFLGKRVSELYIDPYTAQYLLSNLEPHKDHQIHEIGLLKLLCDSIEMKPLLSLKKADYAYLEGLLEGSEQVLLGTIPKEWDYNYEQFLRSFKTALAIHEWINEQGEDKLMQTYGVSPGSLRVKSEILNWLLYACKEFCSIKKWNNLYSQIELLRIRLKYGVKAELLPLLKFRGIGRVRARKLFDKNIKNSQDLLNCSFERLKTIVGKQTAINIKNELGQRHFDRENVLDYFKNTSVDDKMPL